MTLEANVLLAIAENMDCDKCPEPCDAYYNSSNNNCINHWSKILSKINPNTDWKKVSDEIFEKWCKHKN